MIKPIQESMKWEVKVSGSFLLTQLYSPVYVSSRMFVYIYNCIYYIQIVHIVSSFILMGFYHINLFFNMSYSPNSFSQ